jgi:hypothetical protein
MKINESLLIATLIVAFTSNAQITKGNWMMGGSASFGNYKTTIGENAVESTSISISPNIEYFFFR